MKQIKKAGKTLVGSIILAIGVIFILVPGPAILFIPLGLVLLATEYDFAKNWLRRYQKWSSQSARKLDAKIAEVRARKYR